MLHKASNKTTTAIICVTHLRSSHLNLSWQFVLPKKDYTPCRLKRNHFNRRWIIFQPSIFRDMLTFREYHPKNTNLLRLEIGKRRIHGDAPDSIPPLGERIVLMWKGILGSIPETRSLAIRNFREYLPKSSENHVLSKERGRLSNSSQGSYTNISEYVHRPPEI